MYLRSKLVRRPCEAAIEEGAVGASAQQMRKAHSRRCKDYKGSDETLGAEEL